MKLKYILPVLISAFSMTSCNDFLDREPLDNITPEAFFWSESDLAAYTIKQYSFTTHDGWNLGTWKNDNDTDNQVTGSFNSRWVPGEWRVNESFSTRGDDPWNFDKIRNLNYFLEIAVPRWKNGEINGTETNIKHYIGEAYFMRAWQYLGKLQTLGDFPIVRNTLPDEQQALTEASYRRPRNEVARFIISDLDSAIMLMNNSPVGGKNRITRNAALLVKSRAALFEASWETYHKGTNRVPGGPGWPGASTAYLKDYTINIDSEISYFLDEAMKAAEEVADNVSLTMNNFGEKLDNPYYAQFAAENMEGYEEILLWRAYDMEYKEKHSAGYYLQRGGGNSGFTRDFVETFLCEDGLPIYASSKYVGDNTIADVKANRDFRLQLFMKEPGELLSELSDVDTFGYPDILAKQEVRAVTGYCLRKGMPHTWYRDGDYCVEGSHVFRAVEAYLNYIEASCMKNGGSSIDSKADSYWKAIRERVGLPVNYQQTVAATDLAKEKDWAVYSGGQPVSKLLYNIRRERRCELMEEGFRMNDLKRWRALDQVKNYQVEGFKLWGAMQHEYVDNQGNSTLIPEGTEGKTANVSSQKNSVYLRPYQIIKTSNLVYDGYNWCDAHYLSPIAMQHFRITATDPENGETSVIYQNPGWPLKANAGAIGY